MISNEHSGAVKNIIREKSIDFRNRSFSEDLIFNCIPRKLVEKITQSRDSKEKLQHIQSVEEIINSLDSFKPIIANLRDFLSFISKLMQEISFKITICSINILSTLLQSPEISRSAEILALVPSLILKLGDTKIVVRQSVHLFLRKLIQRNPSALSDLLQGLENTNWHVREEIVIVCIASMILSSSSYDYLVFVTSFAKLYDDTRAKIKAASAEALSVLSHIYGENTVIDRLKDLVDEKALGEIKKRLSFKLLPVVNDEYVIFPKDIPKEFRGISSPFVFSSPSETPSERKNVNKNRSVIDKHSDSATSAGTFFESYSRRSLVDIKKLSCGPVERLPRLPKGKEKEKENDKNDKSTSENPIYLNYNELESVNNPSESLQKLVLHTDSWLEQFETVNTIRKILKHSPSTFASKVALHNIVLTLVKWADSLRSSLCKNSLIALKELVQQLGKAADGEIPDILKIFLRKASDTNSFISDVAVQGLDMLCKLCSDSKIMAHLVLNIESAKNPGVRAKVLSCMSKLLSKLKSSIVKLRDFSSVVQFIIDSLTDASPEVRSEAKSAFELLIDNIPDEACLDLILTQGIREGAYRKLKEALKKRGKSSNSNLALVSTNRLARKTFRASPSLPRLKPSMQSASARELLQPLIHNEPEELKQLELIEKNILNPDWKTRYDAVTLCLELMSKKINKLALANKVENALGVIQKGMHDSNLKVLMHTLTRFTKAIPELGGVIEKNIGLVVEPVVAALGCSNSSIRDVALDACIIMALNVDNEKLLIAVANCAHKTSIKGRAAVMTIIINIVPNIKSKDLLQNSVVPLIFKYIDESRADIRNEVVRLLVILYKILGTHMLDSAPSSKLSKIINYITNKLE